MELLFVNLGTTGMALIALPILILFIYTMYHAATNKNLTTYQRSLWILIIILGNLLGWLLYWAIGKNGEARAKQRRNVG